MISWLWKHDGELKLFTNMCFWALTIVCQCVGGQALWKSNLSGMYGNATMVWWFSYKNVLLVYLFVVIEQ
jgi:hypothetical protein